MHQKKTDMGIADRLFKMKQDTMEANLKKGQEFLAANKLKAGITETPSGLQYEVMTNGTGPKPNATSKVNCHYHGTLLDGTIFDSSVQRGQPATFPLNQVIKGWTEGVQLMGVGSKWRFFIPPHLGYGDRQVGSHMGPNSTLIFEVELLGADELPRLNLQSRTVCGVKQAPFTPVVHLNTNWLTENMDTCGKDGVCDYLKQQLQDM